MSRDCKETDDDSRKSWALAVRAAREACIRKGQILPDRMDPVEVRWASEGFHGNDKLEAVRG